MSGNSEAIVKTFTQILDIYKQIYMLMETAKELMEPGTMKPGSIIGDVENYKNYHEDSSNFGKRIVRIPFNIQQSFTSDSKRKQIKYITVMIDDEEPCIDFEPVVVGTTLIFKNTRTSTMNWDGYWWYHWKWNEAKKSNSERQCSWTLENREVTEIQKQDWMTIANQVRSNLQSVQTFGIPLVEVKDPKSLEKEIIIPLLAV